MKTMKKLFALLLAVLMVMGMATTAMAEGITVTISNAAAGHTYEAYQIFDGSLNNQGVLSNVVWGSGVNGSALLTDLKTNDLFSTGTGAEKVYTFAGCADAAAVAQVITGWPYNEKDIKNFADVVAKYLSGTKTTSEAQSEGKYKILNLDPGYYLIKDSTATGTTIGNAGATDYLLQITTSTEISPKVSAPTFEKTVNTASDGTFTKAVDAQVGDIVWFKLEVSLPNLLNDYKQFYAVFEDSLPAGLEPVTGSSANNTYILHANNSTTPLTSHTTVGTADSQGNIPVTLNLGDIKDQTTGLSLNLNDKIIIKYSAEVTSEAVYGLAGGKGNTNAAVFTYSNNMNEEGTPYSTATLTSSASVYVYQAEFTKVDSVTKAPLPNAQFKLFCNVETGSGTEKRYAVATQIVVDANGNTVAVDSEDAKHCVYTITNWTTDETAATVLYSGKDGKFLVKGLDALTYRLDEIEAPDGYNDMKEDVIVTITSTVDGQTLSGLSMSVDGASKTGTPANGLVTGDINNTAGTKLPTTGGIGTTIFYIVGGVLVLGAGAAFVMKRRNEA